MSGFLADLRRFHGLIVLRLGPWAWARRPRVAIWRQAQDSVGSSLNLGGFVLI